MASEYTESNMFTRFKTNKIVVLDFKFHKREDFMSSIK